MTPELNKLVVLDPQWLIDVFKAVITVKPFHHQERGFKDMWSKLEGDGILENKLLQHTWGQMVEERPTFESLLEIMQKFSLLCSWTSSDEHVIKSIWCRPCSGGIHLQPTFFIVFCTNLALQWRKSPGCVATLWAMIVNNAIVFGDIYLQC